MRSTTRYKLAATALVAAFLLRTSPLSAGDEWPRFRGPGGLGVADGDRLAERWTIAGDNLDWAVKVPGYGWSSPILWKDRIFLTTAVSAGDFKQPSTGIYGNEYIAELREQGLPMEEVMRRVRARDNESADEAAAGVRWMVLCLDAQTGRLVWEREAHRGVPFGGRHRKNTYASETPVTDGERIYAYFGNLGLYCYDFEGKLLWSRSWEPEPIYLDFGTASSPVLHGDLILILNDNEEESFITALDKRSGREVWRTPRQANHDLVRSGFATPYVWSHSGRTEIVALGPGILTSYDLEGSPLWFLKGTSAVAAPTPLAEGELLFSVSGSPSERVRPIFAIRSGASGEITLPENQTRSEQIAWSQPRGGSYITSPLLYDGLLYVLYDKGFFGAFDLKTGEEAYKVRIGSGGHPFSSSPWASRGRIYCLSEDGDTFVIEAGRQYKQLGVNSLEEMSLATPAIAHDSIYLRTSTQLYRIRQKGDE